MRITLRLVGKVAAVIVECCAVSIALFAQIEAGRNSQKEYESACQNEMTRTITELPATEDDEEVRQLPKVATSLNILSENDGGISIRGSERKDIVVVSCKHAAARDRTKARQLLDRLRLRVSDVEVGVDGFENTPDSHAAANLSSICARNHVPALTHQERWHRSQRSAREGGSAKRKRGIFFHGSAGDVDLNSRNGGIDIALQGLAWQGRGLDAHSDNGGLTIRVPPDFSSGILAETDSDQMDCKAQFCAHGVNTWEGGRRLLQIGRSSIAVRASTDHAPIAILSAGISD